MKRDKACVHGDKWHPAPDEECWTLDKNKSKRPKAPPTERMFTALQMEQIAKALSAKASKTKKKKRKVSFMSKVDDSSDNSSSSESESYMSSCSESNFPIQNNKLSQSNTPSNGKLNKEKELNYAVCNILSSHKPSKQTSTRATTEMVVELITPKGTMRPMRIF